jgi:hypothetical protein
MKTRHESGKYFGTYTSQFITENSEKVINGKLVKDWHLVDKTPSEDLIVPFWNGSDWVESKPLAEIREEKVIYFTNSLNTKVFNARLWAKAIVMNKRKEDDLDYWEDVYTLKYQQAKDGSADTFLALEAEAEGMELQEFKALVISKFENGLALFADAKAMLEVIRKVVLKDLEIDSFALANLRIAALEDLPETITTQQFNTEFENILNIEL